MLGRRAAVLAAMAMAASACASGSAVTQSTSRPVDVERASDDTSDDGSNGGGSSDGIDSGTSGPSSGDPGAVPAFVPEPLSWNRFRDGVDIALLDVPVDYTDPDGERFELFLARHRALDPGRRIGSLLVNPGGPGFGGTDWAVFAGQIFADDLLDHFDIIGWDPRGTGESDPPIDCIDDFDPYFTVIDSTPETEAERLEMVALAEEFAARCVSRNASIIDFVGTNNSARDIDTIRRALGEDRITYFGFSYGSELGGTWATLFPDTVRAAVLDGAADPNADELESSLAQMSGFQASLETFLDRCSADEECAFHSDGDATAAYVTLMTDLDAEPLQVDRDRPPVNRDVAQGAVVNAMYAEWRWPMLAEALDAARRGDGSGLLALYDDYWQRRDDGTYGNELEAFQAISCADTAERPSVEEEDDDAAAIAEVAPLLVAEGSIGDYFCTFFPPAIDPRVDITGAGAGPIVVIGTTGDPATPFESTVRMANTLEDGRLVVVEADQHTGYGVNGCVVEVVNRYLVDLEPPDDGTECR